MPMSSVSDPQPASTFPSTGAEPFRRHPLAGASCKALQLTGCRESHGAPWQLHACGAQGHSCSISFPCSSLPDAEPTADEAPAASAPVPSLCHLSPAQRQLHSSALAVFPLKVLSCTSELALYF